MTKPGTVSRSAIGATALALCMLLLGMSCQGCADVGDINDQLRTGYTEADGGVRPLSAREYVQLRRVVAVHQEVTWLATASIVFGICCGAVGLVILARAAWADVTRGTPGPDEAQAFGPRAVGLMLVVVGALVVLLTPRNKPPSLEELSWASALPESRDAGASPTQAPGTDAGLPGTDAGSPP